jgi:hypothetical protein
VDAYIYDWHRSYAAFDLLHVGFEPASVLVSRLAVAPYDELLAATPTVLLASRGGLVLGLWKGELSPGRVKMIKDAVAALLM